MTILEINTGANLTGISETADGRFFIDTTAAETTPELKLEDCLGGLRSLAHDALIARQKLDQAAAVIETAATCPKIIAERRLDDAKAVSVDTGTVWRRLTDEIAHNIATSFPNQALHDSFFDNDERVCLSDGHTLYQVDPDLTVWAFTSVIAQSQYDANVKIATPDMWVDLLTHIHLPE
jgi:hypothetical protein